MPLHEPSSSAALSAAPAGGIAVLFTICTVFSMGTVLAMCTCCRKNPKNREEDDEAYGVVHPTTGPGSQPESQHSTTAVAFRSLTKIARLHDRHSQQQHSKDKSNSNTKSTRASAPDRALPQLPADLYTVIDKSRRANLDDDIEYADETSNPMYECIDADNDSMIDPLYSKVGPIARHGDRKYDYPVFTGKNEQRAGPSGATTTGPSTSHNTTAVNAPPNEDPFYQSASQIYGPGSEDPYSSINSESRPGDDNSSLCDPGYARVKSEDPKKLERLEQTEKELDRLYSKIRRSSRNATHDSPPDASQSNLLVDTYSNVVMPLSSIQADSQSISSREPSYRYLTTRESAEVVRERLRQQGQLGPPIREHYYSTIGNEYETVDGASSSYGVVPSRPIDMLTISTGSQHDTSEMAPPPPTSPIPNRLAALSPSQQPSTSAALSHRDIISPNAATPSYAIVSKPKQKTTTFDVVSMEPRAELPATQPPPRPSTLMSTSMNETLLGRRTLEEREMVVEKRNSYVAAPAASAPFNPSTVGVMNRSFDTISTNRSSAYTNGAAQTRSLHGSEQRVFPVEIKLQSHSSLNPSAVDNSFVGSNRPLQPSTSDQLQQFPYFTSQYTTGRRGPTTRTETHFGSASELQKHFGSDSLSPHRPDSRSGLPVLKNQAEVRNLTEKAKQRRKESLEREGIGERSEGMSDSFVSSSSRDPSNEKRKTPKPWRDETEAEKIQRLGTIYTANDYVSPIDLGTERPWPFGGRGVSQTPSPATSRIERGRRRNGEAEGEEELKVGEPGPDEESLKFYRTNENNNTVRKTSQI